MSQSLFGIAFFRSHDSMSSSCLRGHRITLKIHLFQTKKRKSKLILERIIVSSAVSFPSMTCDRLQREGIEKE